MTPGSEGMSARLYARIWRVLVEFFRVPDEPPAPPARAGEPYKVFQPSEGYLRYQKFRFWVLLTLVDVPLMALWVWVLVVIWWLGLLLAPVFTRNMPVEKVMVITVCLLVAGLYLPAAFVSNRARNRQRAISESFPDALDMLMVCVEAGLGLDSAFTRVGAQMASAHPVLAEEFALVSLELRAGKSREAAMRNFAERIGTTEITSFVVLLIQSDQLGTSVAQTLRVQAEEMRIKRMLRAEEKAHMLPVKLSIPLVLCLLPAMIAVAVLPGIIRIIRDLLPAL